MTNFDNKQLVSVIIPNYNSVKYIESTVKSILCQTYSNLEILHFEPVVFTKQVKHIFSFYEFLNDFQYRLFELRGPPSLIA